MIRQRIDIAQYGWSVEFFFDASPKYVSRILNSLSDIGCCGDALMEANDLLTSEKPNIGLTYSNIDSGRSVVVVSQTTSAEEFFNTLTHELHHLVSHICEARGIDMASEQACYLTGGIARIAFHEAHPLLCDECRKK